MINIANYVLVPYNHQRQHMHVNAPKGSVGVYFFVENSVYNDYKITQLDKCHVSILALNFTKKISCYSFVTLCYH